MNVPFYTIKQIRGDNMATTNIPNENTLEAIREIQELKDNPDKNMYSDFLDLLNEAKKELKGDVYPD